MQIRIDRALTNRVTLLTAPNGDRYRVTECYDSRVTARVPPFSGAALPHYEERGVEVALVTHSAADGRPLIWQALGERGAADAIIACGAGTALA